MTSSLDKNKLKTKFIRLFLLVMTGGLILLYAQMTSQLEKKSSEKPPIRAASADKPKKKF